MTDELELLRRANPVTADEGLWRDRPLDSWAERRLNRLLHGGRRPGRARRLALGVAAAAVATVAVLTLAFSGATTAPAAAAPVALVPRAGSQAVPLDEIARRAKELARGSTAGPRRGSHLQAWYMSMETGPDAVRPVTLPEERVTRWNADGSGSELVVATDPEHPGRTVVDAGGKWRTVDDAKVLQRKSYPPGTGGGHDGLSGLEPPYDPGKLRSYLSDLWGGAGDKPPQLLQAISSMLQQWTPGPRENAAISELLADTGGLRGVGMVTDRMGRPGQAYVYDGPDGFSNGTRHMVILDPHDGRVLGIEVTFTKDLDEFQVKAGDVMSYEAWLS
ncbi:CU044_5270 family protein [Streptomyces sp. P1-3]|uniref:CU044_5270 family protein n=1 Tax=Streptomyces sp. P1-3 TaxID=3421658 RepID=UPI003D3676BD